MCISMPPSQKAPAACIRARGLFGVAARAPRTSGIATEVRQGQTPRHKGSPEVSPASSCAQHSPSCRWSGELARRSTPGREHPSADTRPACTLPGQRGRFPRPPGVLERARTSERRRCSARTRGTGGRLQKSCSCQHLVWHAQGKHELRIYNALRLASFHPFFISYPAQVHVPLHNDLRSPGKSNPLRPVSPDPLRIPP